MTKYVPLTKITEEWQSIYLWYNLALQVNYVIGQCKIQNFINDYCSTDMVIFCHQSCGMTCAQLWPCLQHLVIMWAGMCLGMWCLQRQQQLISPLQQMNHLWLILTHTKSVCLPPSTGGNEIQHDLITNEARTFESVFLSYHQLMMLFSLSLPHFL